MFRSKKNIVAVISSVLVILVVARVSNNNDTAVFSKTPQPITRTAVQSVIVTPLKVATTVYGHETAVLAQRGPATALPVLSRFTSPDNQFVLAMNLPEIIVGDAPIRSPYLRAQSVTDQVQVNKTRFPLPQNRPDLYLEPDQYQNLNSSLRADESIVTASIMPPPPSLPLNANAPQVSLVITALGFNAGATARAIESLPREIVFAFPPVVNDIKKWEAMARQRGHTTLLEVPMEPMNYPVVNPGNMTLLTSLSVTENTERLKQALAAAPQVAGITNYLGARFTARESTLAPLLQGLKKEGYFVFENIPTARSQMKNVSKKLGLGYASSHYTINPNKTAAHIRKEFEALTRLAQKKGYATGVIALDAHVVLPEVEKWIQTLNKKGVRLTTLEPTF